MTDQTAALLLGEHRVLAGGGLGQQACQGVIEGEGRSGCGEGVLLQGGEAEGGSDGLLADSVPG